MRIRRLVLVVLVAFTGTLVGGAELRVPARADAEGIGDPRRDIRGKFDIVAASHGHGCDDRCVRHTATTRADWHLSDLHDDRSHFSFLLDPEPQVRGVVYEVHIDAERGRHLHAYLSERYAPQDRTPVRVRRPDRRTLVVEFSPSLLRDRSGIPTRAYEWLAKSSFHRYESRWCGAMSGSDVDITCVDNAPDHWRVLHVLH